MIYPNISSIYNNALGALSDPVKNYSKAWACLKIFSETIRMSSYGLPSNFSSLSGRVKSVAQWVDNKIDTSLAPLSGKDGVVSVCCRMGKIALIMIFSDWCLKQSQDSTTADTNDDARKGEDAAGGGNEGATSGKRKRKIEATTYLPSWMQAKKHILSAIFVGSVFYIGKSTVKGNSFTNNVVDFSSNLIWACNLAIVYSYYSGNIDKTTLTPDEITEYKRSCQNLAISTSLEMLASYSHHFPPLIASALKIGSLSCNFL